nr:hypothetical protein [Mucilaginibacter sp. L294]
MNNQETQVYKWLIKRGSILLFEDRDKIHIELDKKSSESCLLTKEDTEEVISIMTSLSGAIWNSPDYIKEPYEGQIFKIDNNNGPVYWDLEQTTLYVGFNVNEDAIEINYSGDSVLKVSVNYAVEIIQIMTHYYKQFRP